MIESIDVKLKHVCTMLGVSRPELCAKAQVNYKTLAQAMSRNSKVSSETLDEICEAWNIPRDYFSKYTPILRVAPGPNDDPPARAAAYSEDLAAQRAHLEIIRSRGRVGTIDFINWVQNGGSEIVDFETLRGTVDLFYPMRVTDSTPLPYRIGLRSLSTEYFELKCEEHYIKRVMSFDRKLLENVKEAHIQASYRPYHVSDVTISVMINGKRVEENYRRTIAKVPSKNGPLVTAVHAELIPTPCLRIAGMPNLSPTGQ
ncbi:hypothetical protein [Sulfitobacter sp.]|uniref:hypothetical protein n=1 Tax=Sulfitobacter sp. TaxID=1903071 RepID=UPI00300279C3